MLFLFGFSLQVTTAPWFNAFLATDFGQSLSPKECVGAIFFLVGTIHLTRDDDHDEAGHCDRESVQKAVAAAVARVAQSASLQRAQARGGNPPSRMDRLQSAARSFGAPGRIDSILAKMLPYYKGGGSTLLLRV